MKLILVCLLMTFCLGASWEEGPRHYCGRRLQIVLTKLCSNPEDTIDTVSTTATAATKPQGFSTPTYPWPRMYVGDADKTQIKKQRSVRGITDECCLKPCLIQELKEYC